MAIENMKNVDGFKGDDNKHWAGDVFIPRSLVSKEAESIDIDTLYSVALVGVPAPYEDQVFPRLWVDSNNKPILRADAPATEISKVTFDSKSGFSIDEVLMMKVYEQTSGKMRSGYVMDFRYITPEIILHMSDESILDDDEEQAMWKKVVQKGITPKACIFNRGFEDINDTVSNEDYVIVGDPDFFAAAECLRVTVDELASFDIYDNSDIEAVMTSQTGVDTNIDKSISNGNRSKRAIDRGKVFVEKFKLPTLFKNNKL